MLVVSRAVSRLVRGFAIGLTAATLLVACGRGVPQDTAPTTSPAAAATPAPPPAAVLRVVVLGDSLTAGFGLTSDDAYPSILQRRMREAGLAVDVVNAGVSGDTSAGGLRRLDWALEGPVRVLVVALGGNDALRGLTVDDLKRNLTAIIERARVRKVTVILAGMEAPPNLGRPYTAAFRQVYRDVAATHRVALLPFLLEGVAGVADLNQDDGIHPNAAGARRVADNLQPYIERAVRAPVTHD
jgi:acyl-CoA thioesterase-1